MSSIVDTEWIDKKIDEEMNMIFDCKGDWKDHLKTIEALRMAKEAIKKLINSEGS